MSEISEAAKKMVRHYVGVENPQISVFGDVWHIEGDRDNAEELAQHILDLQHKYDALAALTAQPIKLAKDLKLSEKAHQSHIDYAEGYNDRAEMDRAAIRAAGYQVEGE